MPLQSLVLTADQYLLRQLRSVLRDLGIGVEICHRAEQASACLRRRHFDVGILDCDASGAGDVIGQLRTAASSRSAPLFLIGPTDCSVETPFGVEADHLLSRPLSLEQAWRALRGARPQMESTMFRYFRVGVEAEAVLLRSDGRTEHVLTRNVAAGGVGLRVPFPLQRGETLVLRLELPQCREVIEAQAEVAWSNAKGDAGLRFIGLAAECRSLLEDWIGKELEEREFAFVFNGRRRVLRPVLIPATEPAP